MCANTLISIVINNYNYGRFLRQAIDSALAQTHSHTEVIIVDDGSTDESRDIIRGYGDKVRSVLKENGGQGSAFNAGFSVSRGDAICFLDADDMLDPAALSRAAASLNGSEVVKVHWPLAVIDEIGRPTGQLFPDQEMPEGDLRAVAVRDGPLYDSHTLPPTSGNIWSRRFLERVLPMPADEFDHGADVYLHALAPLYGRFARIAQPQGLYRAHDGNHYWRGCLTDHKVTEYLGRFESCCQAMERQLAAIGIESDSANWKQRNFNYLWLSRLRAARTDVAQLVTAGKSFILVDDSECGDPGLAGESVPFLEHLDQYWGRPADDKIAIEELERLRGGGAEFIVFWWTCFWWLEHYAGLNEYLWSHFQCVASNDRIMAFDLRTSGSNGARTSML